MSIASFLSHTLPLRHRLSDFIVGSLKPVYFLVRKKRKAWSTTISDLANMPAGSLGNDIYLYLAQNSFDLIPKAEFHDVYHVLLGYSSHMKDETCIQFVVMGNGRHSLPNILANAVSVFLYPEYWEDFKQAFLKGKRASTFHQLPFESLLMEETVSLRKRIFG